MKGGLVAMVHAVSAVRRAGIRLRGDVWMTAVIDHETPRGKKQGPRRLIERLQGGEVAANAIVIVEGPWAIWSASLGSTIFRIRIESPRGIVHTIHVPFRENPAAIAGRVLMAFEDLELEFERAPLHALCGRERLNVGIVSAGDYPNRLPTPAVITGTWRWVPGKTHAAVREKLGELCARLAEEAGMRITVEFEAEREPFETSADHAIVRALREASNAMGVPAERIGMGLVCDANLYANEAGIPTVCFGPAYETAHSDHERVSVTQLVNCARLFADAAVRFCYYVRGVQDATVSAGRTASA
jgi:acetylornithine deacetylase/succinyl-diaminopimelate desuccinylase-like protein